MLGENICEHMVMWAITSVPQHGSHLKSLLPSKGQNNHVQNILENAVVFSLKLYDFKKNLCWTDVSSLKGCSINQLNLHDDFIG